MTVPRARLLDLLKAQCHLYSTTFNPEGLRLGNKVLRKRLQGPSLVSYYIPRIVDFKDMEKEFEPYDLIVNNEQEDDRLDHISGLKFRGKSAPKKQRTAPDLMAKKKKK